jgi:acyl-CoA reductase-like NAD-dependent aldehyde dehydrogenase
VTLDGEHMERTVDAAAKGRLGNTGQSCVASKRFIVLAESYDAFLSGLPDRFAAPARRPVGPGDDLGPLSSEHVAETLSAVAARAAVRRHQALGLRARALRPRDVRAREPEADRQRAPDAPVGGFAG